VCDTFGGAVDEHAAFLDPGLQARAAVVRQTALQEVVQACSGVGGCDGKSVDQSSMIGKLQ